MELAIKAYKCIFPDFFTDAYNIYQWQDDKQYEVIWGKNQKEAVKDKCTKDEMYTYWELKKHIRTRRFPEQDLYKQEPSKHLAGLLPTAINHLTHSLGVSIGDFYSKGFYRNYSLYYAKEPECEALVKLGLMENFQKRGSEVYTVTPLGKEAVKTLLLITKIN